MSTTIKVCPVCSVSWYADKPEKHMMTCTAAAAQAMTRAPTEMELRVAKAIRACDENDKTGPLATYEELARAAIRAMHTPTTEMLREAGMVVAGNTEAHATVWETMIDAASPPEE